MLSSIRIRNKQLTLKTIFIVNVNKIH